MKQLTLLLISLFSSLVINAGEVTEEQALQKAQQFMQGKQFKQKNLRRAPAAETQTKAYYVFNVENNGGFVIVSGDDRMPEILGYSDKGNVDMRNIPCNMEWLMSCYVNMIDSLNVYGVNKRWSPRRANNFVKIEPLITTHWGQHAPYNNYCPEINGEKCPTGCVATAMAQIINYKKWPQGQTTSVEAYTTENGISMPALESTSFNWENMSDDDIARLMLYCGQSSKMNYTLDGSGAGEPSEALKTVFGYSKSTKSWLIKLFEAEHLEEAVYSELAENRPVFYTGYSESMNAGHAFIVDGYQDGMFHINWGWDGDADGYFMITGATEDVMPFLPTWGSEMLFDIEPAPSRKDDAIVIAYSLESWQRSSYRTNETEDFLVPISFNGEFFCDYDASCYVGIGFYRESELVKVVDPQLVQFPVNNGFLYFNSVSIGNISKGEYYVCPVYRHNETEEWHKVAGSNPNHLIAHVGEKNFYLEHFIDNWDGEYMDYGYQEINGVTYGLVYQFSNNYAYVLPHQLTEKYSGDIVIPFTVDYEGKKFLVMEERLSPFVGCEDLHTLSAAIDNAIEVIDCPNLTKLDLKSGHYITVMNCPKLESIEFPVATYSPTLSYCKSLKTIKFTNIVPNFNIRGFDEYNFPLLTDVYFATSMPPKVAGYTADSPIPNNPKVNIHVPKGCLPLYQNSSWKQWNLTDDNQSASFVKWGYCHGDKTESYGFARGERGNLDSEFAMRITPEDLVAYKGCKITSIEVYSPSRATNDSGDDSYEYVFITKRGTDYLVKQPFDVVRGAWNTVKFDEPYTITGEELFVGVGRKGAIGATYADMTFVPDAVWGRWMGNDPTVTNTTPGQWDYVKECPYKEGPSTIFAHPLPLRFAIDGDHVPEGIVIRELESANNKARNSAACSQRANDNGIIINGVIRNRSLETVTSYTVEWSVDGGEKQSKTYNTLLAPNETEVISIELPPITTNGTHTVATNVTMVNENANQLEGLNMPTLELTITDGIDPIVTGDANADGEVNVTDIVATVNKIMGHEDASFNMTAADVNKDGEINVTDIVMMVNIIMSSGSRMDEREAKAMLKDYGFIFKGDKVSSARYR